MISTLRKYFRLFIVLLWTGVMFTARMLVRPVALVTPDSERRARRWLFSAYARGVLRITGIRLQTVGTPPPSPFYMVSNHLTFFDVFVLASHLGCVFVSRDDLADWPVFGFITTQMQTIYIDRERLRDTVRVNGDIRTAMDNGYDVLVFAESRCSEDGTVLPFKPALLQSAVELDLAVHYGSIHYASPEGHPPASERIIWKGDTGFFEHFLNVASLPYVVATLTFGDDAVRADCRKSLAEELRDSVSALLAPID